MVVKLYISGISGNKEVKKKQQRVQMILDSKQITYEAIDITEPGKEKDKEFMQQNGKVRESLGKYPLPPQIFNDESFCGDYDDFDLANEVDELEKFLHIETKDLENGSKVNGIQGEVIEESEQGNENLNNEENHKVNGLGDSNAEENPSANEVIDEVKEEVPADNNQPLMNESGDAPPEESEKNGEEEEENAGESENAQVDEQVEEVEEGEKEGEEEEQEGEEEKEIENSDGNDE